MIGAFDATVDRLRRGHIMYWSVHGTPNGGIPQWTSESGYDVRVVASFDEAREALTAAPLDVVLMDLDRSRDPVGKGVPASNEEVTDVLRAMMQSGRPTQLLVLQTSSRRSDDPRVEATQEVFGEIFTGLFEPPPTRERLNVLLLTAIQRLRLLQNNRRMRWQLSSRSLRDMLGESRPIREMLEEACRAAESEHHVTICGEPGTGKGLLAQAIHENSRHASGRFARLACRLLASRSLEQQLFGHRVKALPTASGDSDDEDADGGTLVLEDAEFLSLSLQRRLGRHLKRNHSRFLLAGLRRARIVITTSRSGDDWSVADGADPDLWGALGQVIVRTPPLREHPEDIPVLADRFLTEWAFREGRPAKQLTFEALELLKQHSWPGNVRELRRVLNQACALDADGCLSAAALAPWLSGTPADIPHREAGLSLREMEHRLIETTFARCGGNREHTARTLQIGIRTLSGKLREYGYPPRGGPDSNRKAA